MAQNSDPSLTLLTLAYFARAGGRSRPVLMKETEFLMSILGACIVVQQWADHEGNEQHNEVNKVNGTIEDVIY